eukprot:NODE_1134_length_2104_cov_55.319536_g957_i0.p1 GENE.NODE_1134_length_2104_cov_55.319536_g957_i0~~NODE_1134_length_2104_cov_55.319536_g957_i0.p1  ORF type:complete len:586 (+),score=83.83 NODE_1134_length_2104_cov_55.319536_g957_i0:61-1818(+)
MSEYNETPGYDDYYGEGGYYDEGYDEYDEGGNPINSKGRLTTAAVEEKPIEDGLSQALENEQIAEGKYLCARCGEDNVTIECRTCRRIYCKNCADYLHQAGSYSDHKMRAFDPQYEAYKRAQKRGTKFDSNAPSPAVLAPGEKLTNMPKQSKIALLGLIIAFILCVVSMATPSWTFCNWRKPLTQIGQWTTCSLGGCEGTLYFFEPLPCPHKHYKVPVNTGRAFFIAALFFTFQAMVLTLIAQKAVWRSLVMLKAGGMSSFTAVVMYIISISLWMYAHLADAACDVVGVGETLVPFNFYGPPGHCNFYYGYYFAWFCMVVAFVCGALLFDWLRGLPNMALGAMLVISMVETLGIISLCTNWWMSGKKGIINYPRPFSTVQLKDEKTWAGLWRACHSMPKGTEPDWNNELESMCIGIGSWVTKVNYLAKCMNKGNIQAVRGLLITALILGALCYCTLFYAHAFRKPAVGKVGTGFSVLIFLFLLIDLIIWPITMNGKSSCDGNESSHMYPCDTCNLGASYWILLVATLLSIVQIVLMFKSRVGFENWEFLDADAEAPQAKPERVEAEKQIIWLDENNQATGEVTYD